MSRRETALAAAVRYETCATEIRRLTVLIGEALAKCPITIQAVAEGEVGTLSLWDGTRAKNHLYWAYHTTTDEGAYCSERRLNEGEQEEYLKDEDCPHCLEAFRLVGLRRQARKEFGYAKLAVRNIGKAEIRSQQKLGADHG